MNATLSQSPALAELNNPAVSKRETESKGRAPMPFTLRFTELVDADEGVGQVNSATAHPTDNWADVCTD